MERGRGGRICLITLFLLLVFRPQVSADPIYTITTLSGAAPNAPFAAAVNNLGQVAGSYYNSNATEVGYLYNGSTGNLTTLSAPTSTTTPTAANPSITFVTGLNDSGQMIGWQKTPDEANSTGFLYSGGQYSALPGTPVAINNQGQVAGLASFVNGQMTNQPPGTVPNSTTHSYIDTNGTVKDLGGIGNSTNTAVLALNNAGQATGSIDYSQGAGLGSTSHVLFYDGQTLKDLGTLGGQLGYGYAINNSGDIVGESQTATGAFHAFLSQQVGKLIDLGTLAGDSSSSAEAINDKGQIVGTSSGSGPLSTHAFLYQNGSMTDLNNFLPANSGVTLTDAFRINDAGQILAVGYTGGSNWESLYLLTPDGGSQPVAPDPVIATVPEPSTLAILLIGFATLARRSLTQKRAMVND